MRGYEGFQFSPFDGLDNRKTLMCLMSRLGHGLSEGEGGRRRAAFLQSLMGDSRSTLNGLPLEVTPCSAVQGYLLLGAICGALGVPIEDAARKLERWVRRDERRNPQEV